MNNVDSGDEGLWSRSLKGDGDAFGVLFDRHRDRVFRHAYRLSGDHTDGEDILATAFLELWRTRDKVRLVEGSVLPWLLVTTTNIARNAGRSAFRHRKLLASLPREEVVVGPADELTGVQEEMDRDVARALKTLKAVDLQLVTLVIFEEYTIAAASSIVGLTPEAAKSRIHRARQRMKLALTGASKIAPSLVTEGNPS